MIKKLLIGCGLFLACLSNSFAGFYLGPLLSYESVTSGAIGYQGFAPRITMGYNGIVKDSFYLAGELMAGATSMTRNNNPNNVASLKTGYSYGVSVIPGVVLDDMFTAYARVGMLSTNFSNLNTTRTGLQRGLGLQSTFADTWAVRGEYDYVSYTGFSGVASPGEDQYSIGLIHWFS